jgi:guanosine-3',5'-bis(diphosphate) 3'-pyrophosphohydrolase
MSEHQNTQSNTEEQEINKKVQKRMDLWRLQTKRSWDSHEIDLVTEAIVFAAEKHTTQRRKDKAKSPYIEHPLRVMRHLIRACIRDPVTLAVAVLHDTVEDTKTTIAEIEKLFGFEVALGVLHVTDNKLLSKVDRKRLQVIHTNGDEMPLCSRLVKLADKLDNLSDRINNPPEFCSDEENKGYIIWALHVVKPIMCLNDILARQLVELFHKADIGFHGIILLEGRPDGVRDMTSELNDYYDLVNRQEKEKEKRIY